MFFLIFHEEDNDECSGKVGSKIKSSRGNQSKQGKHNQEGEITANRKDKIKMGKA